jgi:2-amino-4-hydroxy-6-hydroxymethyldihydropteridine diphosphokinase
MMRDKTTAFLALGSNVGDRKANLDAAESAVASARGIYLDRASPTYESPPEGGADQPPFLNRVLAIDTWLGPRELLRTCEEIERALGRKEKGSGGPRTADVDILLYGDAVIDEPELKVPHARLKTRPFFLQPLADVAGDVVLPGEGLPLSRLLADLAPYELTLYKEKY